MYYCTTCTCNTESWLVLLLYCSTLAEEYFSQRAMYDYHARDKTTQFAGKSLDERRKVLYKERYPHFHLMYVLLNL